MVANAVNRETLRDALAVLLEAALVGENKPVQAVYNYRMSDFGKETPVVAVTSAGSNRIKEAATLVTYAEVYLNVHIFVLYASADDSWTEAEAEDRCDLIEKETADVITDNYTTDNWTSLTYREPSIMETVVIGGKSYIHEVMLLTAKAYNE